ncbi:hypothetical protein MRX96_023499 [Rhipicephalus microplus]
MGFRLVDAARARWKRLVLSGTLAHCIFFTTAFIGVFMAIVGFFGCCGALRESPCMLCTFFIFLVVIIAAEVTGGIWAWSNLESFEKAVKGQVQHMMHKDYSVSDVITKTIDTMQHDLRCCGVEGPQDWAQARINQKASGTGWPGSFLWWRGGSLLHGLHTQGCGTALWNGLYNNLVLVCAIGLGIAVLQILGLIFTMVLCCAVRRDSGTSFKA